MTRPEVLIFDLFGTLVYFDDSRVPWTEVAGRRLPMTIPGLEQLLEEFLPRVEPLAFLHELRRTGAIIHEQKQREGVEVHTSVRFERALIALGCPGQTAAVGARRMASLHMDTLARAVVCPPGRTELLARLSREHRLALLSNFDDGATARRVLAEAGLAPFFEVIVISDEEGLRKPSRAIFDRTCARLASSPADCLYIGDTLVEDIEGASGAGIAALWIRRDGSAAGDAPPVATLAVATLADVDALPDWLSVRGFSARGGASR